jgi:hypothetical protein
MLGLRFASDDLDGGTQGRWLIMLGLRFAPDDLDGGDAHGRWRVKSLGWRIKSLVWLDCRRHAADL